MMSFNFTT